MPNELNIIWILAIGFAIASLFGYLAQLLKLSPLLGYLLAGYFIGPNFPGYVADLYISEQLANIGVTLLMFAVGLNFNWKDLAAVKNFAVPGAIVISLLSTLAGMFYSIAIGETIQAGLVIGLALCVSSTVVMVRVLADQNLLNTPQGHIAIGLTIVEDLIAMFALILLPAVVSATLSDHHPILEMGYSVSLVLMKLTALGLIIYFFGENLVEKILKSVARTRSHELFTLALLGFVFLIAVASSYFFGVSIALGAFIAGTVLGKTDLSQQAAADAIPMRDAFAVIFFLSVGMLFNPMAIGKNLPLFFGILFILLFIRPLLAFTLITLAKYPTSFAFTLALAIGQIGEYSFILAQEGSQLNILPSTAYDILVACSFISIALNPPLFQLFLPLVKKKSRFFLDQTYQQHHSQNTLLPQAVVIGYGPIGQMAVRYLVERKYHVLVIDQNIDTVSLLKKSQVDAIFGDAAQVHILEQVNLKNTHLLIITTPDFHITQTIIQIALSLNPLVKIIARSHFKSDLQDVELGDIPIVCDEDESSEKMRAIIHSKLEET